MNTILIPTFNESKNPLFLSLLKSLQQLTGVECLFIDGSSTDNTKELIQVHGLPVLNSPPSNRAQRFNLGLKNTSGRLVLLHHPRSVIDIQGLNYFCQLTDETLWGGFRHRFDDHHPILKFTSWYSNSVRARRGILYLDHCLIVPRKWMQVIKGLPEVDIFEDTLLSLNLRKFTPPYVLPYYATTSAVRFQTNGYIRQAWRNQVMKWHFYLGKDHRTINQSYEKGVDLNISH